MSEKFLKEEFLTEILKREWAEQEEREGKRSFWPTDCLKPAAEIFWQWMGEPKTNPIEPEKLLMFKAAKALEEEIVKVLADMGVVDIPKQGDVVDTKFMPLTVKNGQWRIEFPAQEGCPVPITGYLDAYDIKNNVPYEVKSYYGTKAEKSLENGGAPSEHYLHQLAVYMWYTGAVEGWLVSVSRSNGNIFFSKLTRDGMQFTCADLTFNLQAEMTRWMSLYEKIKRKEFPGLDYEYRPTITEELLDNYSETEIKKAIKGERVLSDHRWRPQYCGWKDLWISIEMKQKGFENIADFCQLRPSEIATMMDYLGVEWKQTKAGPKLYKKKGVAPKVKNTEPQEDSDE